MALTIAAVKSFVIGDRRQVIADVTPDNSYQTGGLALTAANIGLTSLDVIVATSVVSGQTFPMTTQPGSCWRSPGGLRSPMRPISPR
jgi:hypothetical protein